MVVKAETGIASYGTSRRGSYWAERWADKRGRLRKLLMTGGVAVIVGAAAFFALTGERYVTSEDAYIRARKLMVTTDVSGLVKEVNVKEGDHVKAGQVLFRLDPHPFEIVLANANAALLLAAQGSDSDRAAYQAAVAKVNAQAAQVRLAQQNYDRYTALTQSNAIAAMQIDQVHGALATAQATLASLEQDAQSALAKLGGNPTQPATQAPAYMKAQAAVDEARRQLTHSVVRAPFDGTVTAVDSLQPGALLVSAMSAFSTSSAVGIVANDDAWIEANLKETELTYVRGGMPVTFTVDTYPGVTWTAHVDAISAGSDSTFSALPAQNSGGNWVKVVQRIPVRLKIDHEPGAPTLRAGMSAVISIDTGKGRWQRLLPGR
jgi:membrane fusion protein (multidrug efflux system)